MTQAIERKTVATSTTPTTDRGVFEAIAACWTKDRELDVITRGAFANTIRAWRRSGKRLPLHWDHRGEPDKIIGHIDPLSMDERDDGLYVRGQVDLEASTLGREAWRLIKSGVVGLSFGYLPSQHVKRADGGRDLHELDVFEVSITPAPMHPDTRILSTKGMGQRERAALLEREFADNQLPAVPDAPEPEPEPVPVPVVVPDADAQRRRALEAEAETRREDRHLEEQRLPDVPSAPEPSPQTSPSSPVVPDADAQRKRAREAENLGSELRRRSEEQRLPDVAEPEPQPEPVPLAIPAAKSQRRRARDAERYAKQLERQREERQLPDVPDQPVEPAPDPLALEVADLREQVQLLMAKRAQAEGIDGEFQRRRARAVARETEEESFQMPDHDAPVAAKTLFELLETKVSAEPFSRSRTSNWVARGGGLPHYVQHVAHDLMQERGMPESQAIQMAIGICKRWCRGGGNVSAETRAKACAAVSEWEALKAKSGKALTALADVQDVQSVPDSGELADLLDQLDPQELAALFEACYARIIDRAGQMTPGKSLAAAPERERSDDADVTGDYRRVDPLRAQAQAVELEFVSGGESKRKSPPVKPAPKPEPELPLEQLTARMRDEMLIAISGLDDINDE